MSIIKNFAISALVVGGLIGSLYLYGKGELNEKIDEAKGLERALETAGISARTIDERGITTFNVIYQGIKEDIDFDGIPDYHILFREKNGTYSQRIVLGVSER